MRNLTLILSLLCCVTVAGTVSAKSVKAELNLGKDKVWKGSLKSIDAEGVFMKFQKDGGSTMSVGVEQVESISFEPMLDMARIQQKIEEREFPKAIEEMTKVLDDYEAYRNIPSNLTPYYYALTKLYFWNEDYEKAIDYANQVIKYSNSDSTKEDAKVYRVRSFIKMDQVEEAEAAIKEFGWDAAVSRTDSAEKLITNAELYKLKGDYTTAIEYAARIVAFYSTDPDWVAPAEILCADLYSLLALENLEDEEGKLFDSAYTVLEHIMMLNSDSKESDDAKNLKLAVDTRKVEWEDRKEEARLEELE